MEIFIDLPPLCIITNRDAVMTVYSVMIGLANNTGGIGHRKIVEEVRKY